MGYNLHITKATDWVDGRQTPITEEEINRVLDYEFEWVEAIEFKNPVTGECIRIEKKALKWNRGGETVYLMLKGGNMTFSYRDDEMIEELKPLAARLNATIQGDEGEVYS